MGDEAVGQRLVGGGSVSHQPASAPARRPSPSQWAVNCYSRQAWEGLPAKRLVMGIPGLWVHVGWVRQ